MGCEPQPFQSALHESCVPSRAAPSLLELSPHPLRCPAPRDPAQGVPTLPTDPSASSLCPDEQGQDAWWQQLAVQGKLHTT